MRGYPVQGRARHRAGLGGARHGASAPRPPGGNPGSPTRRSSRSSGVLTVPALQGGLRSSFQPCSQRNVTRCAVTQAGGSVLVTAYNPLGRERHTLFRVPVETQQWRVDAGGGAVASEVVPRQELPSWLEVRLRPRSPQPLGLGRFHRLKRRPRSPRSLPGSGRAYGAALRGSSPRVQLQDVQAVADQRGARSRARGGRRASSSFPRPPQARRRRHGGAGQRGRPPHLLHPHRPPSLLPGPAQVRTDAAAQPSVHPGRIHSHAPPPPPSLPPSSSQRIGERSEPPVLLVERVCWLWAEQWRLHLPPQRDHAVPRRGPRVAGGMPLPLSAAQQPWRFLALTHAPPVVGRPRW